MTFEGLGEAEMRRCRAEAIDMANDAGLRLAGPFLKPRLHVGAGRYCAL